MFYHAIIVIGIHLALLSVSEFCKKCFVLQIYLFTSSGRDVTEAFPQFLMSNRLKSYLSCRVDLYAFHKTLIVLQEQITLARESS